MVRYFWYGEEWEVRIRGWGFGIWKLKMDEGWCVRVEGVRE
jgi:hypothetical protein